MPSQKSVRAGGHPCLPQVHKKRTAFGLRTFGLFLAMAGAVVGMGFALGTAEGLAEAGAASAQPTPVTAPAITIPAVTIPAVTTTVTSASTDRAPANTPDSAGYKVGGTTATQTPVTAASPSAPQKPTTVGAAGTSGGNISVNLGGSLSKPSSSITILVALTLLAVAPSLLILLTSFTRIIIVLSLTRQALGLNNVPPNQILAGLALFLSLFIMSPVISQVNHNAVQPYLAGKITTQQAYTDAEKPIEDWMLKQTKADDLALFETKKPPSEAAIPMAAVVPAFALSEIRTAFIIGFVIFVPFLVIDLVVSATLMSLGMMMLPPSLVSLPFKLLLFVLVDGWALVVKSLLSSFHH